VSISSIDIGSIPASATRSAIARSASAACRRQREAEAEMELVVAEAGDPVFAPAIGAAARLVVR
jgi:hypothetical protein